MWWPVIFYTNYIYPSFSVLYSAVQNNKGGKGDLNKRGGPTDNLNINKWGEGVQIRGGV